VVQWLRCCATNRKVAGSIQTLAGPIPIQSAVRQGCPLSMIPYALCLYPLLRTLEYNLPGIRLGRSTRSPTVVTYADDVTVIVTQPEDFAIIHEAVRCYEKATGAKLNSQKSKALPTGGWSQPATALGIGLTTKSRSWGSHMEPLLQNR